MAFGLLLLPLLIIYIICLGVSLAGPIWLVHSVHIILNNTNILLYCLAIGLSSASGFFLFGCTLILVVPFVNWILRVNPKPWRGPAQSLKIIPWYYHNALVMLVRYSFLDYITPTPLNILFYRLMGMKIGKGSQIGTTNITDPCLITIGENVYVGGSSHIIAHYSMKGYLILAPVVIGNNVTIGLKATILGGVEIGNDVTIKPNAVLFPKTKIKDGTLVS